MSKSAVNSFSSSSAREETLMPEEETPIHVQKGKWVNAGSARATHVNQFANLYLHRRGARAISKSLTWSPSRAGGKVSRRPMCASIKPRTENQGREDAREESFRRAFARGVQQTRRRRSTAILCALMYSRRHKSRRGISRRGRIGEFNNLISRLYRTRSIYRDISGV